MGLELDAIYRVPIDQAAAGGLALEARSALYRQLAMLDRRNRSAVR